MPVLEIIRYGNSRLGKRAEEIKTIDKEIEELAHNMIQTMHAAPGIGLAAPQVNVSKRLITVDLSVGENSEDLIILINPELISQEGETILEEGCLSVPDYNADVQRAARIHVTGFDRDGNPIDMDAEGFQAIVLQHEIDHLNGKLFIERISALKRRLYKRKIQKQMKQE